MIEEYDHVTALWIIINARKGLKFKELYYSPEEAPFWPFRVVTEVETCENGSDQDSDSRC